MPSEIYETLPFPNNVPQELGSMGETFAQNRARWCRANDGGLTDFYNAFHDAGHQDTALVSLRVLLSDIDRALFTAYGWPDLHPEHGFHEVPSLPPNDRVRFTFSEAARLEVLRRLSALNRQRYQEEQDPAQTLKATQGERTAPRKRAGRPAAKNTTAQSPQTPLFE